MPLPVPGNVFWPLDNVTHYRLHSFCKCFVLQRIERLIRMATPSEKRWRVLFRRKVEKSVRKMPRNEQVVLANLVEDLQRKGPIRTEWRNFSRLSRNEYHCHLSYSWVACWRVEQEVLEIEVYYAGSRENASY
jgi:hypothetical protein